MISTHSSTSASPSSAVVRGGAPLGDAVGELDQLELERLLVGDHLVRRPGARAPDGAALDDQLGRGVAQERRWEAEPETAIGGVEHQLLPVSGDPGQVDPGEDDRDITELELDRRRLAGDAGMPDAGRRAEEAAAGGSARG